MLRKALERAIDALRGRIGSLLDDFTSLGWRSYFGRTGYASK